MVIKFRFGNNFHSDMSVCLLSAMLYLDYNFSVCKIKHINYSLCISWLKVEKIEESKIFPNRTFITMKEQKTKKSQKFTGKCYS